MLLSYICLIIVHVVAIKIGESSHILYREELEDVVHTCHALPVRCIIHHMRVLRELKQPSVSLVLLQIWIVLVGKMAPHALDGKPLAPLEFLDERNAVEQLAVHIPRECPEHLAVVEEFPVFHQTDCCLLLKVREVDRRQDEHWERHLVPLCLSDGMEVEITPTAEPLALVDAQLGDIAVILTAQASISS